MRTGFVTAGMLAFGLLVLVDDRSSAASGSKVPPGIAKHSAPTQPRKTAPPAPAKALSTKSATSSSFDPELDGATGRQASDNRIHSTTREDLVRQARESAGREDPFVALTLPEAHVVQPLPLPTLEPTRLVPTLSIHSAVPPSLPHPRRLVVRPDGTRYFEEITTLLGPSEPRWTVMGILNTGREAMVVLELDGQTREARVGELLEDGSKVVGINGQQVTLLAHGRRYVKTIGGLQTP